MPRSEWVTSNWTENEMNALRRLGFQEGWFQCSCGSCDSEPSLFLELPDGTDVDDWENENVFTLLPEFQD